MKNRKFTIMVTVVAFFAAMLSYADGVKDAGALMSDISAMIVQSKANVAAAVGGEGAVEASAIDAAVMSAANAALVAYNALVKSIATGDQAAAAIAFENLQKASQVAKNALEGNLGAGDDDKVVVATTGGVSKTVGETNIEIDLKDPAFVQKFQQKQSEIYKLATAFGGDGLDYKFATPE